MSRSTQNHKRPRHPSNHAGFTDHRIHSLIVRLPRNPTHHLHLEDDPDPADPRRQVRQHPVVKSPTAPQPPPRPVKREPGHQDHSRRLPVHHLATERRTHTALPHPQLSQVPHHDKFQPLTDDPRKRHPHPGSQARSQPIRLRHHRRKAQHQVILVAPLRDFAPDLLRDRRRGRQPTLPRHRPQLGSHRNAHHLLFV